jgi:parvulin-like peptidyl-prolyl isomerase
MNEIVNFEGVKATVQNTRNKFLNVTILALISITLIGCKSIGSTDTTATGSNIDSNGAAATVNGKAIKMEEVERGIKQQAQGQESKLSPLELAGARLQVLGGLIQNEVLYQKAEKEGTVPKDDDVTAEINRQKTTSGLSAEKFDEQMKQAGLDETSYRENIKKVLAVKNLIEKITGKIEPPKDSEIDAFYNGNKAAFVNKRGVKLAAIIIDPANNGEGDTTTSEQEAVIRGNEIIKQIQQGQNFADIAREKSEDQSRLQGGDLGYVTEDELKQNFSPQAAATLMNEKFPVGNVLPVPMQGKFFILKLQERKLNDENLTLESPGVREKVIEQLIGARKQLLSQSYAAIAMNEAKIENFLAQKVVSNPNELSGARPASAQAENTNANTNSAVNTNTSANVNAANVNTKPAAGVSQTPNGGAKTNSAGK